MTSPAAQFALVHESYVDAFRILAAAAGGEILDLDRAVLVAVGVPLPLMNVAFLGRLASAAEVTASIRHFEAMGVPFCLRFPGPPDDDAGEVMRKEGLAQSGETPGMTAEAGPEEPGPGDGVVVDPVRTAEDEDGFVAVNSAAFGIEPDLVRRVFGRHLLSDRVEQFVGRVEGDVVSTSCAVLHRDAVGVYNVATLPQHRARGFGARLTRAAIGWGVDRGRRDAPVFGDGAGGL